MPKHKITHWIRLIPNRELSNPFLQVTNPELCDLFFHLVASENPMEIPDSYFRDLMYKSDIDYMTIPGLTIERFQRVTVLGNV